VLGIAFVFRVEPNAFLLLSDLLQDLPDADLQEFELAFDILVRGCLSCFSYF